MGCDLFGDVRNNNRSSFRHKLSVCVITNDYFVYVQMLTINNTVRVPVLLLRTLRQSMGVTTAVWAVYAIPAWGGCGNPQPPSNAQYPICIYFYVDICRSGAVLLHHFGN